MLSYRHSFHAGNFADVIKHIVLIEILEHLVQKETPFEYIDTHAGAGLYNLRSRQAQKLEEHTRGISKLSPEAFPELSRYFNCIQTFNKPGELTKYPGSPLIAEQFLRSQDRAWLFELHPQDFKLLSDTMKNKRKVKVSKEDGLKGVMAHVPPNSRRGLVLIDPSYELKNEYEQVFNAVVKAYKKFSTGVYAIWYPVVDRRKIDQLERRLVKSGIKHIQRFELGVSADMAGQGMTASGMIVINPPWKLFSRMSDVLPKLVKTLSDDKNAFFKCDILVEE